MPVLLTDAFSRWYSTAGSCKAERKRVVKSANVRGSSTNIFMTFYFVYVFYLEGSKQGKNGIKQCTWIGNKGLLGVHSQR